MDPVIRAYAPEDLEPCRELWRALNRRHREIYADPTIGGEDPGLEFDAHVADPRLAGLWVAECGGVLVGLCGLLVEHGEGELEPIVVAASQRGKGTGALLARRVLAEARKRSLGFLNVRPAGRNVDAIRFFHREGFELLGRLELCIGLEDDVDPDGGGEVDVHGLRFRF